MNRNQTITNLMANMGLLVKFLSRSQMPVTHKGGPTRAQLGVLIGISHWGVQTTKDLAERFEMSSSATTQLVNGLVKEKLLVRTEDKADRRKIWLSLTVLGQKKLAQAKQERLKFLIKLLKPLNDQDLAHLKLIQHKIMQNLKTHAGQ